MTPKTERFELRLDEDVLQRIDGWRGSQDDLPSRAEAFRRLVEKGLAVGSARGRVQFSDGEKLILLAMRDLAKHLKMKDPETDLDFIAKVILGGHYWAPGWRQSGVFHGHEDNPDVVDSVLDVLDMWDSVERAYEQLSKKDRQRLAEEVPVFGKDVRFRGFDGNREAERIGIADFLINELRRFSRFFGRDLNSHMPTQEMHDRMLRIFRAVPKRMGGDLTYQELVSVLKAMPYPK